MAKKINKSSSIDTNLFNFHFPTAPPVQQQQQQPRPRSNNNSSFHNNNSNRNNGGGVRSNNNNSNGKKPNSNKKEYQNSSRRTAEDRASARRKAASNMFPLHSSPDHAFVLTRHVKNPAAAAAAATATTAGYSFHGPDQAVSWESVRVVKYLVSMEEQRQQQQQNITAVCPICLDSFTAARITKCGHCFCLPCLVHHVQSTTSETTTHSYSAPKCPCCAIPLHLQDVRPVLLVTTTATVQPPSLSSKTKMSTTMMRFVKLHRVKDCPAPYLPRLQQPRRSSPHAAPCVVDADAAYCKFNYLDVASYQELLEGNMRELLQQQQQQHQQMQSSSSSSCYYYTTQLEGMCLGMALQMVQQDRNRCIAEAAAELALEQQFQNPAAGMYQPQLPHLLYFATTTTPTNASSCTATATATAEATRINVPPSAAVASSWDEQATTTSSCAHPLPAHEQTGLEQQPTDVIVNSHSSPVTNGTAAPASPVLFRRDRGDSIASGGGASIISACSNSSSNMTNGKQQQSAGGSMYANEDEYSFYQAEDGSLCFLSAFNMNCLRTEFSTTALPSATTADDETAQMRLLSLESAPPTSPRQLEEIRPPLPDVIKGKVLEVERVQLTADVRQRLRFLSHLPLYSDICFVEISLSHILSNRTKKEFKKDFLKRNQTRISRETAEKRSDDRLKRQEIERINELKARSQRIDPMDDFFQPVISPEPEPNMTGDDFGPSISRSPTAARDADSAETNRGDPGISFSQICRSGEAFPSLSSAPTETNFPALGSSPPTMKRAPPPRPWGSTMKQAPHDAPASVAFPEAGPVVAPIVGKKTKGKKIVLFSTGASRGDYF